MAEENNGPTILVTGGAGYIGTHCIIELLQKDYNVVAIDNFTNSVKGENGMPKSLQKVSEMKGKSIKFFDVDICDKTNLRKVFSNNKIDCVLHIAALKSVSESFESPLKYYSVNVAGSIHLVEVMEEFKVKKLFFRPLPLFLVNQNICLLTKYTPLANVLILMGEPNISLKSFSKISTIVTSLETTWIGMLYAFATLTQLELTPQE